MLDYDREAARYDVTYRPRRTGGPDPVYQLAALRKET